jgi:hypothetical protein
LLKTRFECASIFLKIDSIARVFAVRRPHGSKSGCGNQSFTNQPVVNQATRCSPWKKIGAPEPDNYGHEVLLRCAADAPP